MKMLMPHSKQQGFSLMEVMIGALLLAVALLGLARLQVIILANSGSSRIRANALAAAQDKMEELRSFSTHNVYSSLTGGTDTPSTAYANLTRTWNVTNCTPTPCKYRNVSVTVSWTDADNTAQQVQLTSEIAEADPVQAGIAVALLAASSSTTSSSTTSSSTTSSGTTSSGTTSSGTTSSSTTSSSTTSSSTTSSSTTSSSSTSSSSSGGATTYTCVRKYKNNGGWEQGAPYPTSTPTGGESCCTVAKFQSAYPSPSNNNNYTLPNVSCP